MAASFPTSVKSFTTRVAGDTIQPGHVNDLQDEVTAVETALLAAWTAFTPTWTNLSAGDASVNAGKYLKIGRIVFFRIDLVWGSTTAISGNVSVNFPVAATAVSSYAVGRGEAVDLSTGDAFELHARLSSSTVMALFTDNGTKLVASAATVPFTWTDLDELHLVGFYESAA